MSSFRQPLSLALLAIALIALPGCLKTRTQLKGQNEPAESSNLPAEEEHREAAAPKGGYEIQEIKGEITRISGKLEEIEHRQRSENFNELKEYLARLDARIADIEKNQVLVMSETKALKDEKKIAAIPLGTLLSDGHNLLEEKNCEAAAEKFRLATDRGQKGKDAAEAFFGYGEAEFCAKSYKKAIVQYSKVQDAFAKSHRVPTALYKIGLSFDQLGMKKEARGFYAELSEKFPKSPEAKRIRAKVRE